MEESRVGDQSRRGGTIDADEVRCRSRTDEPHPRGKEITMHLIALTGRTIKGNEWFAETNPLVEVLRQGEKEPGGKVAP